MNGKTVRHRPSHHIWARLRSPSSLALIGLNLAVYFLLARWVADNIQLATLAEHLRQIPALPLLGTLAIHLAALALYGVRMSLLLGRDFRTGFSIVNLGYALNTLIPLRLGEAMKIYLGHRFYAIPLIGIFAASIAEKVADLFKLALLGLIVAGFAASELIPVGVLLPLAMFLVSGLVLFVLFRRHIARIVMLLPKGGRLRRIFIELHKHAGSYPVGRVVVASLAIWLLNIGIVYFVFNTYLPGIHISVLDAAVLLLILALAFAVPAAPAGLGLFEAGIVAYLSQKFGVGGEAALAAAVVFHLVMTFPQLALAGWLIWRRR